VRANIVIVLVLACLGAAAAAWSVRDPADEGPLAARYQPLRTLDLSLLDAQFQFLRRFFPRPVERDVVLVGIDPATVKQLPEPIALWHRHLGTFFKAMAQAGAATVGIDVIMPDRSYDSILPGYDAALMQGIIAARRDAGLILGLTVDMAGEPHVVHKPFMAVAGADSTGYVNWRFDPDGVVRRFREETSEDGRLVPTLAGQMARKLGAEPGAGFVDYWRGAPFDYVPLASVLDWYAKGDTASLEKYFQGKPVLLGVILPFEDRVQMSVPLWKGEPASRANPGVMVHAQALRSMLGSGLINPAPAWILALAAGVPALLWLLTLSARAALGIGALVIVVGLATTTALLTTGWYVPTAAVMLTALVALFAKLLRHTALRVREHARLRHAFGGSVSPQVLAEITAGRLSPSLAGTRSRIAVLFVDVRDFTARSEAMPPEMVIQMLNRYFHEVITATHAQGGTIDKFMGDGIMAFFGAPQKLEQPAAAAIAAGKEMLSAMGRVNAALKAENKEPITISIGIHIGDAVVGHIGSSERYEYTAIGDVVNVASRLESLTKEVGYALVCTEEVLSEFDDAAGFVKLGPHPIRGHSPVMLYGFERRSSRRGPKPGETPPAQAPAVAS